MDRHWIDWCRFLRGRGSGPADFSLSDLIEFSSRWSSDVSSGSHKLAAATLSTTLEMSLGVNLIDLGGAAFKFSKRSSQGLAAKIAKPSRRTRVLHTEDTLDYVHYFCGLPDNDDLTLPQLSLKVLVLLRLHGLRSIDLATMPAGDGAGLRFRVDGMDIRSYLTKTAKSNNDLDRKGWTSWTTLTEIDTSRVSGAWAALGITLRGPEKVCAARALRSWVARMLPLWSKYGEGFEGIQCLARSCFTHVDPVQSGKLMLASNDLIAAQCRNFHNRRVDHPSSQGAPVLRRMGLKSGSDSISPGFLRHCAVSRLLFLDRESGCLNLTRHTSISTSRQHYLLPLADSLRCRLVLLQTKHSALLESMSSGELLLV
jgi:hypothetical protein